MKALNKVYNAALYMRLSKDDEGAIESASISVQRKILRSYAEEYGYTIFNEYIDDGWSGTNFNRPSFNKMLKDIESGNVNMVITKDLSRLGRDYITAGQYTEMYFPERNVRYIAINDGYDSLNPYNDIAPFKHVINEMYARDTSKKIRSAFAAKMKEGSFIGSYAPFGYQKDPLNKNHLIIDHEAAIIVKEIFQMAENSLSPSQIAHQLSSQGTITPSEYRNNKTTRLNGSICSPKKEWTPSMVCKLLKNMVYIGHMAQGKTKKVSFKSQSSLALAKNEWCIVENTHEPIISQQTYTIVQSRSLSRKIQTKNHFKNLFSGIAKCMDCKRNMSTTATRKKGSVANLVCGGYKLYGSKECSNHFIDYNILYGMILHEIKKHLSLSDLGKQYILDILSKEQQKLSPSNEIQAKISQLQKRSNDLTTIIKHLYEDNVTGKISDERFSALLNSYEAEQKDINTRIGALQKKEEAFYSKASQINDESNFQNYLKAYETLTETTELSRDLLLSLIEKIEIGQGYYADSKKKIKHQAVKIYYRFTTS